MSILPGDESSGPPRMTLEVANAIARLGLAALAMPTEVAWPLSVALAKRERPDDATLRATIPYVARFFRAAMSDGLGEAMGLSRSSGEKAVLRHRAELWPELSEADAIALARRSLGHMNGEEPKVVLAELAIQAIRAGEPIPTSIAPAVTALLGGMPDATPRHGPDPNTYIQRNAIISVCVWMLCMFGFNRTRNAATSARDSACSIVATIANMSEAAVVKIDTTNLSNSRARRLEEKTRLYSDDLL